MNNIGRIRMIFQSTPPARGATTEFLDCRKHTNISIHAPREGGDNARLIPFLGINSFQSTPPARGATLSMKSALYGIIISIHAPREGGDVFVLLLLFA